MIKIIKQLEKFKDNIASRFLVEVANSKRISNFSKEVIGTKFDTRNKQSKEYKKSFRYLTDKEVEELKNKKDLGVVENRGKARKNQKAQRYLDRKNR
tara:strand:+ start:236 stop:526 length:291 start_codon:yes stop_codon:yes gene_type:complete